MDESKNTLAFILSSRPYKENDVIVSVFSRDFGKLSLLARGLKKQGSKMSAHLEPLVLSRVMIIKGKNFDYLSAAIIEKAYLNIRNDLSKIFCASEILSLFSELVKENEKDENLFNLLFNFLNLIESDKDFSEEKKIIFQLRFNLSFLKEIGYKPEMYNCLACGSRLEKGGNFFDIKNGGVICPTCALEIKNNKLLEKGFRSNDLLTISDNCAIIIRYLIDGSEERSLRLSKKVVKEANNLVKKFIIFIKN